MTVITRKKRVAPTALIRHLPLMTQNPYHYDLIARALAFIDQTEGHQPSLDDIAAATGLSPAHFQRVFSQWVGVSPKRYQQYLMLDHAKVLLQDRFTVLDTALESGLSGSSRLHDLFLRWEAMSPGEYAAKGAGLVISFGWFNSPFGEMLVMGTQRGICAIAFTAESSRVEAMADLTARWPHAEYIERPEKLQNWVDAALGNGEGAKLHLIGAPFQIKVWEALLSIPTGHVTTYSEIAQSIGNPKAVRAVGTAVGRNPVSWFIPCHRALRKSGGLGGYHWGLPVKRALLAWESARLEAAE
jgi:AraC family transcriptional regulator, regulatory protein of adaptative response / methylated-DNA-[protein]-cysteine methyltransferase